VPQGTIIREEKKMTTSNSMQSTTNLVRMAVLTAIVMILSYLEQFIIIPIGPFTFNITLALMPIVIGSIQGGVIAGGWLGLVFGFVVLTSGQAAAFIGVSTFGTILVVLLKGAAAGLIPGAVYKLLSRKNKTIATFVAALTAPIANTGIFVLGCYAFFLPKVTEWASGTDFKNVGAYIILGLVGVNFIVEFISTIVLSGGISRVLDTIKRSH